MNNPYSTPGGGPLFGLIRFLAMIGLLTIFGLGIFIGVLVSTGGF